MALIAHYIVLWHWGKMVICPVATELSEGEIPQLQEQIHEKTSHYELGPSMPFLVTVHCWQTVDHILKGSWIL